jgi:hypothetical protein
MLGLQPAFTTPLRAEMKRSMEATPRRHARLVAAASRHSRVMKPNTSRYRLARQTAAASPPALYLRKPAFLDTLVLQRHL